MLHSPRWSPENTPGAYLHTLTKSREGTILIHRKQFSLVLSLLALCPLTALASITVNSPASGSTVAPQVKLAADATICSSQAVTAMGFSLDNSTNTTVVKSTSINATVTATTGSHVLHVKAWGNAGALCVSDVAITVSATVTGVSVSTPGSGASVSSPFALNADALSCSSQPVGTMGYSIDNGATTMANATTIKTSVSAPAGAHTLHVKAWGNSGAVCVSDVPITVAPPASTSTPPPATAPPATGVAVSSPANGSTVNSPFSLGAAASSCSSQQVTAMGYSLDNSTSTAIVQSNSVSASVTAAAGAHTLHVKAWGNGGAVCVKDVPFTVSSTGTTPPASNSDLAISNPANGATVSSPIKLAATASNCSSQSVTSMSYALDGSSANVVSGTAINTQLSASAGQHTLTVKAMGASGAACTSTSTVTVPGSTGLAPANATSVSNIESLTSWKAQNDPATGGSTSGTTNLVNSPSLNGSARVFNTSFSNSGGELYHISFADDVKAYNFLWDGWVYFTNSASNIANLEIDMNQVMANGQTVIYGFQCDGYSGTWDYTKNAGTPTKYNDTWVHSSAPCNPRNWTRNTWHHVQISYSRDDAGNVTYHSVWLDSKEQKIDAKVPSAFALGWGPVLLTNFQIDGLGSGSNTVYLDNLTISRW
jgi:Bacterial Ig domain